MKIVGGTFGTDGSAYFSRDGYLVVDGAKEVNYKPGDLISVVADQVSQDKLSFMGLVFGVLVTAVLTVLFQIIGLVIGLLVMYYGSKYKLVDDFVSVSFADGEQVRLECTPRAVKKLVQFKG